MKPVNIYTLTRVEKEENISRLEKQMSKREHILPVKKWEVDSLRTLLDKLSLRMEKTYDLEMFYSFKIPKLGKEFDLLSISDETVINIELKSNDVGDESIGKQLTLNRYYLATLGKTIKSYTYVSNTDRLVRLSNSGRVIEADWDRLCEDLQAQRTKEKMYDGDIEELFSEEKYLISPLTDPERFLRQDYFLTSQQKDIERNIFKNIDAQVKYQGFTGLPGTGKTLLLYDLAMRFTWKDRACVIHCGSYPEELVQLNDRLKRIDFCRARDIDSKTDFSAYRTILVDEGHRMTEELLKTVKTAQEKYDIPVVFSYDTEEAISPYERISNIVYSIEVLEGFIVYRLTNRIRTNAELSSFIHCLMQPTLRYHKKEYPSVSVAYANNSREADILIKSYIDKGYIYICRDNAQMATCREFEGVVMFMDNDFYYDENGYLRAEKATPVDPEGVKSESRVRQLYHGLSRGKNKIALVVMENENVFDRILQILQEG